MQPLVVKLDNNTDETVPNNNTQDATTTNDVQNSIKKEANLSFLERAAVQFGPRDNPEFFLVAVKFSFCFFGLQASYLTWGYMQELIMTTKFTPTEGAPHGIFPAAAFCVFANRFLAVIVAMIVVKRKHGSVFGNNRAPLWAFTPCAISNTTSSWCQYASLNYVSFPLQTIFKSSKIIPVMLMGKVLQNTSYPLVQYFEAFLITVGVAIFSLSSKEPKLDDGEDASSTASLGIILMLMYIFSDSFTSQWQSRIYNRYGKQNIDPYQMMLGVNSNAIIITTLGLVVTGDFLKVYEFLLVNPQAFVYNIITAITSATGQLFIYYTIKEFGPIPFTIIMTVRQIFSFCISSIVFQHHIGARALLGATMVFGVLFYQIYRKYNAKREQRN